MYEWMGVHTNAYKYMCITHARHVPPRSNSVVPSSRARALSRLMTTLKVFTAARSNSVPACVCARACVCVYGLFMSVWMYGQIHMHMFMQTYQRTGVCT